MKTPRTALFICVVLATTLALSGCSLGSEQGSGTAERTVYDRDGFDAIDIGGSFDLDVVAGDDFSVEVTVDDNFTEDLNVKVRGSTLFIGFKSGSRNHKTQPSARVVLPLLNELSVSGASTAAVDSFDGERLSIDVSGASEVTFDSQRFDRLSAELSGASEVTMSATVGDARIELSGASELTWTGDASNLSLDASGASNLDVSTLELDEVTVDISGASAVELGVASLVTGDLSGASTLVVGNDVNVRVDSSGASSVERR